MKKPACRFALLLLLFLPLAAVSQLQIDTTHSPGELVLNYFLSPESDLQAENIAFLGQPASIARFRHKSRFAFIDEGIVLSTGNVFNAKGPNSRRNRSYDFRLPGDSILSEFAGGKSHDAAILEFDFISPTDSIFFSYCFASEEYPEYINRGVNDVFVFLVTNTQTLETKNIATLPQTGEVIAIDNINEEKNTEFYLPNTPWKKENLPFLLKNPDKAALSEDFEFDGFTTVLQTGAKVEPGVRYRFKIAIADVGDGFYDSAVFLKARSFQETPPKIVEKPDSNLRKEFELLFPAETLIFDSLAGKITVRSHLHFAYNSAEIGENSNALLDSIFSVLKKNNHFRLEIHGHTDSTGGAEHNLKLSEQRAQSVALYLKNKGIAEGRIQSKGFGSSQPLATSDEQKAQALNRRVEFIFHKKNTTP